MNNMRMSQRTEKENLGMVKEIDEAKNKMTNEMIKEFAERLWDELLYNAEVTYDLLDDYCVDVFDKNKTSIILDRLVKEMTETNHELHKN